MIRAKAVGLLILSTLLTLPSGGQQPAKGGAAPHAQTERGGQQPGSPKLGAWLRAHKDLPLDQQEKLLESNPNFKRRSPQVQAQLKKQLEWFNGLPAQQKEKALRNMEYWEKLTPDQHKQIKDAHQHMETLPAERRVMVRKELHTLRRMPQAAREQRLQSDEFKSTFSDQEQSILRNLAEINPPAQTPAPSENATPR